MRQRGNGHAVATHAASPSAMSSWLSAGVITASRESPAPPVYVLRPGRRPAVGQRTLPRGFNGTAGSTGAGNGAPSCPFTSPNRVPSLQSLRACSISSCDRPIQRNGHRDKTLISQAGNLDLAIPELRSGSFFPALLERRRRIDQDLYAVIT
ncbi:hypothetical protein SGFS_099980 [Streptomyces graminofaciens]|uniref:Transposase n=1 Tax=Streptomyces graminofaciens TaxID=68212 RepID=A0ABM7FLD1_9ACTN|nr:hypothetical protein SGFS_099980 [Streptomyces graminofaciens]